MGQVEPHKFNKNQGDEEGNGSEENPTRDVREERKGEGLSN